MNKKEFKRRLVVESERLKKRLAVIDKLLNSSDLDDTLDAMLMIVQDTKKDVKETLEDIKMKG